jgi:hypothetical protein
VSLVTPWPPLTGGGRYCKCLVLCQVHLLWVCSSCAGTGGSRREPRQPSCGGSI